MATNLYFGWKVYCVAVGVALFIIYAFVLAAAFRPVYLADLAITLPSFAGLCGYAFRRRLLWASFWRIQSFVFPAWEIVMNLHFSRKPAGTSGLIVLLAFWLFFVPQYWALWRYGYRSPDIWEMPSSA